MAQQLAVAGLPVPVREYRFAWAAYRRRWPFDFAWPALRLAVEVEGGGWTAGQHTRGQGIEDRCEKGAHALRLGWRVMYITPRQIHDGRALAWIIELLAQPAPSLQLDGAAAPPYRAE